VRLRGCDVSLLSYRSVDQYWGEWAAERGVAFKVIESRTRVGRLAALASEMKRTRPDVVHAYLATGGLFGCVAAALAGVPVILYGERSAEVYRERWLALAMDWGAATVGSGVICNTRAAAGGLPKLLRLPAGRFHYIPNGFVAPDEPTPAALEAARQALDPGEACVLMVGNFAPYKGYDEFLEIARAVLATVPQARFVGVGDGPLLEAMRARCGEPALRGRVAFIGARRDVPALLKRSHVFLHSGYGEGMSNAVMEACWAGLPVVAVKAGGHPELVVHGETGFLFERGDTGAAASNVASLLRDSRLRTRLGAAGRDRVLSEFSVDALVARHAALYEKLVSGARL
jgi:glycosyltransferase involved in cell wall biosynthesis